MSESKHQPILIEERRGEQRLRSFKGGRVRPSVGINMIECTVRNQSNHGARLEFNYPPAIPKSFTLQRFRPDGTTCTDLCELQWRTETEAGVRVVRTLDAPAPANSRRHTDELLRIRVVNRYPV